MPSPVTLKIKFKSTSLEEFIERYSVDVSKGGIFIRTPKPLAVGTALKFEFQLQNGNPLLEGGGTVVWVREQDPDKSEIAPGMGLRFDQLPPQSQAVLEQVLQQKQQAMEFSDRPTRVATEGLSPLAGGGPADAAPGSGRPELRGEPESSTQPESEEQRKERLEQILFADEDKASDAAGASPIAEPDPTPTPEAGPSATPSAPPEEKSSAAMWLIILVVIAAGAFLYFKYVKKDDGPTTAPEPKAVAPTLEPVSPDMASAPAPKGVTLKVVSTPEGAKVLIDGKDTGKVTPAEIEDLNPEEEVTVQLDLPGKKLVSQKLKPVEGEPVSLVLAEPANRTIHLTTDPPGAAVYLGKRSLGVTPYDYKKKLRPGRSHRFQFFKKGFKDASHELPAEIEWAREGEDEAYTVNVTLEELNAEPKPARKTARKRRPSRRPKRTPEPAPRRGTDQPAPAADPGSKKTEPKKTEPKKTEPKKTEPKKTEQPAKAAPAPAARPAKPTPKKPSWAE